MKKIEFKDLVNLWNHNLDDLSLYIHSPFCVSECTYCVYRGNSFSEKDYKEFYWNYLPTQIKKYISLIHQRKINTIYFGGGTPNIKGTLDHLVPSLELINDISCNEKIIELHMGFEIKNSDIELLSKYGFTTVILCIQSFDDNILHLKNRPPLHKNNNIDEIIKKFHDIGINVGVDLMIFPNILNFGLDDLYKSINILSSLKNLPDEVTFATDYLKKTPEIMNNIINILLNNKFITDHYIRACGYHRINENDKDINCLRFLTPLGYNLYTENKFYSFIPALDEMLSNHLNINSLLGIGSFKNKDKWVYSRIGNSFTYIEVNNDLKKEPQYYLTTEISFLDQIYNFINFLNNLPKKDLPPGTEIHIKLPENDVSFSTSWNSEETFHRKNLNGENPIMFDIDSPNLEYNNYINSLLSKYRLDQILLNK